MGNDGGGAIRQIISPSARTGFGVPSTGGGGTSTALTVASGADSMTVTSPISIPFTSATGSPLIGARAVLACSAAQFLLPQLQITNFGFDKHVLRLIINHGLILN